MKAEATRRFKKNYQKLSSDIQKTTDKKLELLEKNLRHPSLRAKKVKGREGIWEASITDNYRITFEIHPDKYLLRTVGEHDTTLKNP